MTKQKSTLLLEGFENGKTLLRNKKNQRLLWVDAVLKFPVGTEINTEFFRYPRTTEIRIVSAVGV